MLHAEPFFRLLGFEGIPVWIGDSRTVRYGIGAVVVWQSVGFYMVLFLAAMEAIPQTFYEAAVIDGATRWHQFWHITIPLLWDTMQMALVFAGLGAFDMFALTRVMVVSGSTQTRPSDVLATYLYEQAFEAQQVWLRHRDRSVAILVDANTICADPAFDTSRSRLNTRIRERDAMKRKLFDRITGKVIITIIYIFLGFWSLMVIFPMLWVIFSSFKTDKEIFFSPWQPPTKLIFDNFVRAFSKAMIGQYFLNSLIVIIPAIFFTLLFSAMTGYVLARFTISRQPDYFLCFPGGDDLPGDAGAGAALLLAPVVEDPRLPTSG